MKNNVRREQKGVKVRLEDGTRNTFRDTCRKNETNMQLALENFVLEYIKKYQKIK